MAGTTYSKFFWSDWAADPKLILCSPGAQALWMRMLCLASEAEPVGHVLIGSRRPSTDDLVAITRFAAEDVERWQTELVDRGVCDRTREGVLTSRRMIRDTKKQRRNSEAGQKSARVRSEKQREISTGSNGVLQPPSTTNQNPSTTNQQQQGSLSQSLRKVDRLGQALGIDPTTHPKGPAFIGQMVTLEQAGIDFEKDLIPAIEEWRAKGHDGSEIQSIGYFRAAATAKRDGRILAGQIAAARPPAPELTIDDWRDQINRFATSGFWNWLKFGPSPVQEGCRAPKDFLEKAEAYWNEHGQAPREGYRRHLWEHEKPVPFFGSNVIMLPAKTG